MQSEVWAEGKRKNTILVVDDQKINRRVLTKILQDEYRILEAENGQQAFEVLQREKEMVSVILLDIVMPVMDGFTFLHLIKQEPHLKQIPVVVQTNNDGSDNEIKALDAGANDFITKPYTANIIKHRVASIIELRESADMIRIMKYDRLTGLATKEYFYHLVEEQLREQPEREYMVICSDITGFKMINDIFGAKTGDELLKYAGTIFPKVVKEIIVYGYLGVDHFAALLPRASYDENVFEKIVAEYNQFPIDYKIDVRFGIYKIDDPTISPQLMCDRAILALDLIKDKFGTHYVVYDDKLRDELLSEQLILDNMEDAIREHQFQVYLQPKYDSITNTIVGAEALVRWIHPKFGFMSPGRFIPLFEHNGFIRELDRYVWEEACRFLAKWKQEGKELVPISVNVSRNDLYVENLTDEFLNLVKKYAIDSKYLHLEITESAYTEDAEEVIRKVGDLKKHGFVIEMDDFGTGYSSLSMLSDLPIDIIKLDMSFVRNELRKENDRSILSFIISIAKWLNLRTIAEGVETADEMNKLKAMDCHYIQGYYYAKPMPMKDAEELMAHSKVGEMQEIHTRTMENEIDIIENKQTQGIMLIVDDVEINRAILREMFQDRFTIIEASNGKTAYDYICEHSKEITVVLLDLVMPIMDGFQLLVELREEKILQKIPVLVSSQGNEDNEYRALTMGAVDYINKPYHWELVRFKVERAIRNSQ